MSAYLYILKCSDGSYYIGATKNLNERLLQHQKGESKYTSKKLPVELMYSEEHETKAAALKREKQIKSWKKRKAIEKLFMGSSSSG